MEQTQATEEIEGTKLKILNEKTKKFPEWYTEVIVKAELIEYYDISGCYILRPGAYAIWEAIQTFFDAEIKKLGVENSYFPVFVSKRALVKEQNHIEGFAPEVAWVTKYSDTDLPEPIALRPTSETIMYGAFNKWVKSHRDLPLKINQWSNIVRWEFSSPTPFIRSREFLWQEGHTAHATEKESDEQTYQILELYRRVYEEILAVPVIKGVKTDNEKFAGGSYTTTVEAFVAENGRGIQAATSHNLGQNFAKMFDIQYLNEKNEREYAWQTSWGLSIRSIGAMIMIHGDNKGLVLPPKIAKTQVVIVPIPFKDCLEEISKQAKELEKVLREAGIKVQLDERDHVSAGWKYNYWELKGVPLRLELGPKDLKNQEVRAVMRHNGKKFQIKWSELAEKVDETLTTIQKEMFETAKEKRDSKLKEASDWEIFMKHLNDGCMVLTPWCMDESEEANVKNKSKHDSKETEAHLAGAAKTLCIPLEQEPIKEGEKCFFTGKPAKKRVLWGRSY